MIGLPLYSRVAYRKQSCLAVMLIIPFIIFLSIILQLIISSIARIIILFLNKITQEEHTNQVMYRLIHQACMTLISSYNN